MIVLSPTARQQITDLRLHYEGLEHPEAIRNLTAAIEDAAATITRAPDKDLPAPRPYPGLVSQGWRWVKAGRYWFAYVPDGGDATIAGVFHETANIPGRVQPTALTRVGRMADETSDRGKPWTIKGIPPDA